MNDELVATRRGVDNGRWTFLTNHGHVLLALYRDPDLRQRDIANLVGITEGAVQRILYELETCGYLDVHRIGRRNHYRVHTDYSLRHPLEAGHSVGDLLCQLAPIEPLTAVADTPHDEPRRTQRPVRPASHSRHRTPLHG